MDKKKWTIAAGAAVLALLVGCMAMAVRQPEEPAAPVPQTLPEQTQPQTQPQQLQIEEEVLFSENGITLTATGLEEELLGQALNITVANASQENIIVTSRLLSVNGIMLEDAGLYQEVAAGKNALAQIQFWETDLKQRNITQLGQISFTLHIMNSDTYDTLAESELITLRTSAYGSFTQQLDDTGKDLYTGEGIRIVSKGLQEGLFWDGMLLFFLENSSDRTVTVYAENVSVNGFMVDAAMWVELRGGTAALEGLYLLDLEQTDIETVADVRQLEFSLRILDSETWQDLGHSGPIRLDFSEE